VLWLLRGLWRRGPMKVRIARELFVIALIYGSVFLVIWALLQLVGTR
jgi:hypothetical protein